MVWGTVSGVYTTDHGMTFHTAGALYCIQMAIREVIDNGLMFQW